MSLKHIILKRISTDDWLMILAAVALSRLVSDRFLFQNISADTIILTIALISRGYNYFIVKKPVLKLCSTLL